MSKLTKKDSQQSNETDSLIEQIREVITEELKKNNGELAKEYYERLNHPHSKPNPSHHSDWEYWDKKNRKENPHHYDSLGRPKTMC